MPRDPNTLSNYNSWLTKHIGVNLKIDFEKKRLKGFVNLQFQSLTEKESKEIILDTSHLLVSSVKLPGGSAATFAVRDRVEPYGSPLHVAVPDGVAKDQTIEITIGVETTDECTALQWLTPAQTSNKKHPYMFSQCQAIHARSVFPCQDTPDVKAPISFEISSPLPVVASGISEKDATTGDDGDKVYKFKQTVPIPSYLFALASGDLAMAPIGPRSMVATGPDELEACQWELREDMEKFMEIAEKIVFPYAWGQYNVLVLPPSFPYGGMSIKP